MHTITVAALIPYHKGNATITDVLKRLDKDALIGTAAASDPTTGKLLKYQRKKIGFGLFDTRFSVRVTRVRF